MAGPRGSTALRALLSSPIEKLQDEPIDNMTFFVADVECDDLDGPYDDVFSRFGTMFFNRPGAALRNIYKALSPGGTLNMIVWRRREDRRPLF